MTLGYDVVFNPLTPRESYSQIGETWHAIKHLYHHSPFDF